MMSQNRVRRGSTLAEVIVGMLVLTVVILAVLGILIQSGKLDQVDTLQTEVLSITQGLIEERVDAGRSLKGFNGLSTTPLSTTSDPALLYKQEVSELSLGLKKVSITTYYADPAKPTKIDPSRPNGGQALALSIVLVKPVK